MIKANSYTRQLFYGSRRMVVYLTPGHVVNRKRLQRLMRVLGLVGSESRHAS